MKTPMMVAAALLVFGVCLGPPPARAQSDYYDYSYPDQIYNPELAPQLRETNPSIMSWLDDRFIDEVGGMNNAELIFSRLAVKQATSDAVRNFAQQMIADHTALGDQLRRLARYANVFPPLWLDEDQQREYEKLQSLSGPDFDRVYLHDMQKGHFALIELLNMRQHYSRNQEIQDFISRNKATVKEHLHQVNDLVHGTSTGMMPGSSGNP
jgi:putative membrane protein